MLTRMDCSAWIMSAHCSLREAITFCRGGGGEREREGKRERERERERGGGLVASSLKMEEKGSIHVHVSCLM